MLKKKTGKSDARCNAVIFSVETGVLDKSVIQFLAGTVVHSQSSSLSATGKTTSRVKTTFSFSLKIMI